MVHRLRSSIRAGEGASAWQPGVSDEPCRRKSPAEVPAEADRRAGSDRRAARQRGLVERAALVFRGKTVLVTVLNSSRSGVTVETGLMPRIGERVRIAIPGREPAEAVVRWARQGRLGLDLGDFPG